MRGVSVMAICAAVWCAAVSCGGQTVDIRPEREPTLSAEAAPSNGEQPADNSAGTPGIARYRGHWFAAFERTSFTDCSEPEGLGWWWERGGLIPGMELVEQVAALDEGAATLYLEVDGTLTERGQYGHLGKYSRELTDAKIRYVRYASEHDCQ